MRNPDRSSRILLAGALLSVALHTGLMLGFVRWSGAVASRLGRAPAPPRPAPLASTDKPPLIRLGLERSAAATLTWVGFEQATEHQADQSATEQSAFTTAPPGPSAPAEAPHAQAAPETPAAPVEQPPPPQRQLADELKTLSERLAAVQRQLEAGLGNLAASIPSRPGSATEGATPPPPTAQPKAAVPPTPNAESPAPPAASGNSGLPGALSDKESLATSVKNAPTVRPGQVLAGQGLDIQTRVPRWTYTTMLTRRPRNPTVRITFGRDGAVRQAEFVRDDTTTYNTGFDDVDQPLLNAIYGWTARGKAIRELKPADPGVSIMITVILSG